jgi:hypothetical protein
MRDALGLRVAVVGCIMRRSAARWSAYTRTLELTGDNYGRRQAEDNRWPHTRLHDASRDGATPQLSSPIGTLSERLRRELPADAEVRPELDDG